LPVAGLALHRLLVFAEPTAPSKKMLAELVSFDPFFRRPFLFTPWIISA
jgi:hypothetical protein